VPLTELEYGLVDPSSLGGQITSVRSEHPGGVPRLTAIAALSNLAASSTSYVRPHLIERGATEALLGVVAEPETQDSWSHQNLALHALTNLSAEPAARSAIIESGRLVETVPAPCLPYLVCRGAV